MFTSIFVRPGGKAKTVSAVPNSSPKSSIRNPLPELQLRAGSNADVLTGAGFSSQSLQDRNQDSASFEITAARLSVQFMFQPR